MGELLATLRVGGRNRPIRLIKRKLMCGGRVLTMRQALRLTGGLLLGEGDTGKSTYARMLADLARERGPVELVPLRRRNAAVTPPPLRKGETATVIFDGLDEYPEAVRDIIDLADSLDPDRYHVWVTSRACDAASRLAESVRFERIYNLAEMTREDIVKIAESAGLDGYDFLEAVGRQRADDFLDKPGGATLLMQLFANGALNGVRAADMMETLALAFAAETRDGHTSTAQSAAIAPERLLDAASWIAAALELGESEALWLGPKAECPEEDLPFDELPLCDFTRAEIAEALGRRLFEPLTPVRLRVSYSQMPYYLVGRWIARRVPDSMVARFNECYIAWAACIRPDVGLPFVKGSPKAFLRCHELIRTFGFDRMLDAMVKRTSPYDDCGDVSLLAGFDDFAEYLMGAAESPKFNADKIDVLAQMLCGCRPADVDRAVAAIVRALLRARRRTPEMVECVCLSLDGLCGTARPKALEELRPIYEGYRGNAHLALMKLLDYPSWLLAKKRPAAGERIAEDANEAVATPPTEREAAAALEEERSPYNLASLMRAEQLRGLPYESVRRAVDEILGLSGEELLDDPKLFGCAIAYAPERALKIAAELVPNYWKTPPEDRQELEQKDLKAELQAELDALNRGEISTMEFSDCDDDGFWEDDYDDEEPVAEAPRDRTETCAAIADACGFACRIRRRGVPVDGLDAEEAEALLTVLREFGNSQVLGMRQALFDLLGEQDCPDSFDDCEDLKERLREMSEACRPKPGPVAAKVVAVADGVKDELVAAVAEKVRNKGGRPRKSDRAADSMTQREVAVMFNLACDGDVCNESMVSNWESFVRTEGRRGASPPEAEYNGRPVVYTADLRRHPTAENKAILAAIIERFRSTRAVKDGIAAHARQHYKSEESLFRARGGIQTELAKRRE